MIESETYAQRLLEELYRIARCRHAIFRDMLSDYGVTLHQFHLLMYIKAMGDITVTDLSDKMMASMPTASRMINTLCDLGMTRKSKEGEDKRSTYVTLTPRGKKAVDEINRRQREMLSKVLEKMPSGDLEAYLQATERVADGLAAMLREEGE